jgi:hypothetical protein
MGLLRCMGVQRDHGNEKQKVRYNNRGSSNTTPHLSLRIN